MDDDQTPPEGFEPQPDLGDGQAGGIQERPSDLIEDAEDQDPDDQPESNGEADDGDDNFEDDDSTD